MTDRPLPPGFTEAGPHIFLGPRARVGPDAYEGLVRVTTGSPAPGDESHDCDALGCTSAGEHVVSRVRLADLWGYPRPSADYVSPHTRRLSELRSAAALAGPEASAIAAGPEAWVCGVEPAAAVAARAGVVVSINDYEAPIPPWATKAPACLALGFDDVPIPHPTYRAVSHWQVRDLIDFAKRDAERTSRGVPGALLVHCGQGISRSTAAFLVYESVRLSARNPTVHPAVIARAAVLRLREAVFASLTLRGDAPVKPNPRVLLLADEALGFGGALVSAVIAAWPTMAVAIDRAWEYLEDALDGSDRENHRPRGPRP